MSYCVDKGIPHSQFLEWSDLDRAKLVAYLLEDGERCKMCGTSAWEWEDNKRAYVGVQHYCHGCYVRDAAREDNMTPGTTIELRPYSPELIERQRKMDDHRRKIRLESREEKNRRRSIQGS